MGNQLIVVDSHTIQSTNDFLQLKHSSRLEITQSVALLLSSVGRALAFESQHSVCIITICSICVSTLELGNLLPQYCDNENDNSCNHYLTNLKDFHASFDILLCL